MSVLHKLLDFEEALPEWRERARAAFLGADARLDDWEAQGCGGYAAFGYTDEQGDRLIDAFARRSGNRLSKDESAALERLRQGWFSVFEVTKARLDVGLELLDLVGGRSVFAHEKEGSVRHDAGDCVAAWVVELDDHFELPVSPTKVPPDHRAVVLAAFQEKLRTLKEARPSAPEAALIRETIPSLHETLRRAYRDSPSSRPLPQERAQAVIAPTLGSAIGASAASGGFLDLPGPERAKAVGGLHDVPRLPHEIMRGLLPRIDGVLAGAVRHLRGEPSWSTTRTYSLRELREVPEVRGYVESFALHSQAGGYSKAVAARDTTILLNHLFYMVNFEAHYRKTFWVDESLAYMLRETRLDVQGRALRPPFACSAFVFTDRPTIKLCVKALSAIDDLKDLGADDLSFVTVYVVQVELKDDAIGLGLLFLFDARKGEWPYLVSRPLFVRPEDDLETILERRHPKVPADTESPFLSTPAMKELVHLAINSILYATAAHLEATVLESPARRREGGSAPRPAASRSAREYSDEDVYYLPGKIPISRVRQIRKLEDSEGGGQILRRFMVRGHWRRALPDWKDQNLRWIEPYWKGPDMAMIVEREYRMKP